MKKLLVVFLLSTLTLTACGKEGINSKDLQKEYGLTKEEANLLADLAEDLTEDTYETDLKPESKTVEEMDDFKLVEASDIIKNSSLEDNFVQVGNIVFDLNERKTVKEVFERLKEESKDIALYLTDEYGHDNEITEESLAKAKDVYSSITEAVKVKNSNGDELCNISFFKESNPVSIYSAKVSSIFEPYGMEALNFFYSGNYCAATFCKFVDDKVRECESYKKRVEEYPPLRYVEWEDWLAANCSRNVIPDYEYDDEYNVYVLIPNFQDDKLFGRKKYKFTVDVNSGNMYCLSNYPEYYQKDEEWGKTLICSLEFINNEEKTKCEEYVTELLKDYDYGYASLVGWYIDSESSWTDMCIGVFKTESGNVVPIYMDIYANGDGSLFIDSYTSIFNKFVGNECFSIEELESLMGCTVNTF